jgi:hypothetical protein
MGDSPAQGAQRAGFERLYEALRTVVQGGLTSDPDPRDRPVPVASLALGIKGSSTWTPAAARQFVPPVDSRGGLSPGGSSGLRSASSRSAAVGGSVIGRCLTVWDPGEGDG